MESSYTPTFDIIIAGSGAAGTFASYVLQGTNTLVLDAGKVTTSSSFNNGNLYDLRKGKILFEELIGGCFESLNNIERHEISLKLKPPLMRYVIEKVDGAPNAISNNFHPVISYARGGLANAWGAQVYRFNDNDLKEFPTTLQDLEPYYDKLTEHLGISGTSDDLEPFHGPADGLQPPLELTNLCSCFLSRYKRKRSYFQKQGIYVGRPRLAVLSKDYNAREKCAYDNTEFFQPHISAIYSPAYTLQSLIDNGRIQYLPGYLIERYLENEDGVTVFARNLHDGSQETFQCKKLILCLGALNTARIVLYSNNDFQTKLPVLENPCSFTSLISPMHIGMPLEKRSYSSQLNVFYIGKLWKDPLIGMIYSLNGILRSDVLFNFPLTVSGSIVAAKYVLPAMCLLQVFYPADKKESNYLKVDELGNLIINFEQEKPEVIERLFLKAFRRIGFYGFASMIHYPLPGMSIHYGGSLPMKVEPQYRYETFSNGRLNGSKHVYIGDSANFSSLPAKNLTFTIMANSMRIAEGVKKEILSSS